jgi:hypothetical protein
LQRRKKLAGTLAHSRAGTDLPIAANLVSSEIAANSAATRGLEPFFALAIPLAPRGCLVAVGICGFSTEYTLKPFSPVL